tara:strand:+ start:53558 stop:53818 length:261 start_codon:yes stop_codon:yes gene_type:complete
MEVTTNDEVGEICLMVVEWHEKRLATLQSVVDANTSEIRLNCGGEDVVLTGDIRKGFIAGLNVAIEQFSSFPLKISRSVEEEDDDL